MTLSITTLLAAAKAATPGKRQHVTRRENAMVTRNSVIVAETGERIGGCDSDFTAGDAAFIASASPDVITALCEEVLRLREVELFAREYLTGLDGAIAVRHPTAAPNWVRFSATDAALRTLRAALGNGGAE